MNSGGCWDVTEAVESVTLKVGARLAVRVPTLRTAMDPSRFAARNGQSGVRRARTLSNTMCNFPAA